MNTQYIIHFYKELADYDCNDEPTKLCEIMYKYGSDKSPLTSTHHNYTKFYNLLFETNFGRYKPLNILEIGIGSINTCVPSNMSGGVLGKTYKPGASLRGWKEYFPNSTIYGCDIDVATFSASEERIHCFYLNQLDDKQIKECMYSDGSELSNIQFDLIIDDGLHYFPLNARVVDTLIAKLKYNGLYIIEDIINDQYDASLIQSLALENIYHNYVSIPNKDNKCDNNLYVLYKHK